MKKKLLDLTPFLIAALLFLIGLFFIGSDAYQASGGRLIYSLDDPYIHMAIARNCALHHVFGLTQYEFSSSTSSPLWTLLIAAWYRLFGVGDWAPGLCATFFALAGLYVVNSLCLRFAVRTFPRLLACLGVVYFTPLIPLVSTGMEHTLHLFFVLMLIASLVKFLEFPSHKNMMLMCLAGFLATGARYESLFIVATFALCLIFQRHRIAALLFVVLSSLPVIVYGVISISQGSYFLPNSLMLKGNFPEVADFESLLLSMGGRGFDFLLQTPHLYSISILLLLGAFLFRGRGKHSLRCATLCLASSILIHLQYASVGWFYRYEAYLVGASMPLLACLYFAGARASLSSLIQSREYVPTLVLAACSVLLIWPLHRRAVESLEHVALACHHVYRQQYHMADFLRTMYEPGVRVALNDVGAVTYYADTDTLDLWGLGTIEVTRAKRAGKYDSAVIEQLLRDRKTDVVMVYTDWFSGLLPTNLIAVASWSTMNNYFGKTVTFFGTSDESASLLNDRLHEYQKNLTISTEVKYELLESTDGHVR